MVQVKAVDARTGEVLWKYKVDSGIPDQKARGAAR